MDEMEWGQAKKIALDIYGNTNLYGNMGKDGDTKNDRDKENNGGLKPDVNTIGEMIETEDDALDGIIDDMLAILPRVEEEYLVSGACLKCSLASKEPKCINGLLFNTFRDGTSLLEVENNDKIDNASKANINDYREHKSIFPFGNCNAVLSEEEKQDLKAGSVRARIEGICYRLIKISGRWENEPARVGMEYFKYNGYPGINGMSKLFCYKGGKIMAVTSGQENRNISVDPRAVTKEDLRFAIQNGISGTKIYALADIRDYFAQYPKLMNKTTIFAFEGLADERPHGRDSRWNGENASHPNGQFGAIMIVAKEGKLTYYEGHASTLPDNMKSYPTVCEGVYETGAIRHQMNLKYVDPYAALRLYPFDDDDNNDSNSNRNDTIGAYNSKYSNDIANGVNLHMAGKISDSSHYSEGCITVPVRCWIRLVQKVWIQGRILAG